MQTSLKSEVEAIVASAALDAAGKVAKIAAAVKEHTAPTDYQPVLMALAESSKDEGLKAAILAGDTNKVSAAVQALVLTEQSRVGELTATREELARLRERVDAQECEAFVAANANKISPAMKDSIVSIWKKDRETATKLVGDLPALVNHAAAKPAAQPTGRDARILALRDEIRADMGKGGTLLAGQTIREVIDGNLLAEGLTKTSDDEAAKLGM